MISKKISLLIVFLISISSVFGQRESLLVELPKDWKFQTGDQPEFSNPDFDDRDWKSIKVGSYWEKQGYAGYNGIAWYRARVVIPSSIKSQALLETVCILLGKIDDADETYFNGKKIGGLSEYNAQRTYLIPFSLINWDKENTISIRVNDLGGDGGMHGGIYSIRNMKLSDIAYLTSNDKPSEFKTSATKCEKNLLFNFRLPVEKIEGTIHTKVYNQDTKDVLFSKDDRIVIGGNADSVYRISVLLEVPATCKIVYSFTADGLNDTLEYSTLFCYKPTSRGNDHAVYPFVKQTISGKSMPFDLENIQCKGYLNERLNANLSERLLNIDEIGILECYYRRPGKQTWVGEYVGKYLQAASLVWRSTHNARLKTQMDRIVEILISCQNGDGYLGTYLPSDYWTEWDVWAHKYNLLGLISYYSVTGFKPALETSKKMGDLLCKTFGENLGQRNIIESAGHVGMPSTSVLEAMTDLYSYTGEKKYLDFCFYIIKAYDFEQGPKIISTLTTLGKVDKTANGKAYEMMSNLIGIVKLYQLTGDERLLNAAKIAWDDIATNKLYITGTASEHELFQEDQHLPAGNDDRMGEGCVTTTWLKFSQALYYLTGEPKFITEIEKTIYNHLFAAENPQTGCVSYYTALQGKKPYRCSIDAHCCLASIPRGIATIPELLYTKSVNNGCYINIYSSGSFSDSLKTTDGKLVQVKVSIDSEYPANGNAKIKVSASKPAGFTIALHVPLWCKNYIAKIEGQEYNGIPGEYLELKRDWKENSIIEISMDFNIQELDGGKSYPGFVAIKTGPQILAFDQALNPEITNPDQLEIENIGIKQLTISELPANWFGAEVYRLVASYNNKPVAIKLVPFAEAGQTGGEVRVWMKKKY